jgi:hypothetical protein
MKKNRNILKSVCLRIKSERQTETPVETGDDLIAQFTLKGKDSKKRAQSVKVSFENT